MRRNNKVVSSFSEHLVCTRRWKKIRKRIKGDKKKRKDVEDAWAPLINDGATRARVTTCKSRGASIKMIRKDATRRRGEDEEKKRDPVNLARDVNDRAIVLTVTSGIRIIYRHSLYKHARVRKKKPGGKLLGKYIFARIENKTVISRRKKELLIDI